MLYDHKNTTFSEEIPTILLFIFISVALEEFCGVGLFPFCKDIAFGRADEVYRVYDAWNGIFACAEDGKLDGEDAVEQAAVLVGVSEGIPCREDVGGAEGVH